MCYHFLFMGFILPTLTGLCDTMWSRALNLAAPSLPKLPAPH